MGAMRLSGLLSRLIERSPAKTPSASDLRGWWFLAIVQIGVAYVLVTRAIRYVPAFEATTVLLLEPVMNPIWAWMVQAERPGAWALAGGGVILSATLLNTWRQARRLLGPIASAGVLGGATGGCAAGAESLRGGWYVPRPYGSAGLCFLRALVSTCGVSHPSGAFSSFHITLIWLIDNYPTGAAS